MYSCETPNCTTLITPKMPSFRVVVETREKAYPPRVYRAGGTDPEGNKGREIRDPGGNGQEIVRERRVCPGCRLKHLAAS